MGAGDEERQGAPLARRGANRDAQLQPPLGIRRSQRRPTTIVELEHQESIRGDRHDVSPQEEEGRERRPLHIQGTRRGVRQSTEEQGAQLRYGAFARNIRTRSYRSATFKSLCAVGCISNLRVRQFDVDA
eukprot:6192456-Pleurochrysis_carterae.AAC.2